MKKNELKFVHCLFMPSLVVVAWIIASALAVVSPVVSTFLNSTSGEIIMYIILGLLVLLNIMVLIQLIIKKDQQKMVGIIIGIPLALVVFALSIAILIGFGLNGAI